MNRLFKILGLIMIFCVSSLTGFLKSVRLRQRYTALSEIYRSMSELKERIRMSSGEIERLVAVSFENETVILKNGRLKIQAEGLDNGDALLLRDFFSKLGMSDSKAECERTELYMNMLEKRRDDAEKSCNELCKLYNTLGILCGSFICIFFL